MVRKFRITGGHPLRGKVLISGSKNAFLPCISATILTSRRCEISNLPHIHDVVVMNDIIRRIGGKTSLNSKEKSMSVRTDFPLPDIPHELSIQIRGSVMLLGSILAKTGRVKLNGYGGCDLGKRPINIHLDSLEKLGAKITIEKEFIDIRAEKLTGSKIKFPYPSVGATANILMASSLAEGTTEITNIAVEPEIVNLVEMLRQMGSILKLEIEKKKVTVTGREELQGCSHKLIPDRIEAGTYAIAAGMTQGDVILQDVEMNHLDYIFQILQSTNLGVESLSRDSVRVYNEGKRITPVNIRTEPHPGFPTDLQPLFTTMMTMATGSSRVVETVFDNRFKYVEELKKIGAKITIKGNTLMIEGPTIYRPGILCAPDLRGGAALILAALTTAEETEIYQIEKIDRGYETIDEKLNGLGAIVERY